MSVLDRNSILEAMKLKTEEVELDNGKVIVSELSANDYMTICELSKMNNSDEVDMKKFTPTLIAYSVVDETGNRIFTDGDVMLLARSSQKPFMKIAEAAKRINGLGGEEVKNSDDSQRDFSFSG